MPSTVQHVADGARRTLHVEACSPAAPHRSSGLGRGCDRVAPPARAWLGRRRPTSYQVILDGGVMRGTHIAKALALGADVGGMALPLFRSHQEGGVPAVRVALQTVITSLTYAFALTGSRNVAALRGQPRVLKGELKDWLGALS